MEIGRFVHFQYTKLKKNYIFMKSILLKCLWYVFIETHIHFE